MTDFSLANAPATPRHRRLALTIIVAMIAAYIAVIPFASIRLAEVDSFVPTLFAIIFVADLVTAVLLFAQFRASGLRPLLVLACGYLFSSLIVVAHLLTYPGAFSPTGLLGAGPQTAVWLNPLWRFGLSAGFAAYAFLRLRDEPLSSTRWAPRSAIPWAVAIVVAVVGSLIFATTVGHDLLPTLISGGRMTLAARIVCAVVLAANLTAFVLLMRTRGRSILDVWLAVAAAALAAESTFILFVAAQRYDVAFYAIRLIALPVSKIVLFALLWELLRLYTNLAASNQELRRERASRLTSAATLMGAIAHDVRQPLAAIRLLAYAGQQSAGRPPLDAGATGKLFAEIKEAAGQASEVFDGFLRLVRGGKRDLQSVDMNTLALEAISLLKKDLDAHDVAVVTDLAPGSPVVEGHPGQLREVMLNLMQNAIDAMAAAASPRVITIRTSRKAGAVSISIEDTGAGIDPAYLMSIFDPFVTTKAKGTGLGLAICKMIVDQHGGRLTASSGKSGARFEITLPAGTEALPASAADVRKATVQATSQGAAGLAS
ncbi:MAG TPA: MASE4 domain-containing protein [Hyphomonadaceae bacterium]